jgi:hypothetical protein
MREEEEERGEREGEGIFLWMVLNWNAVLES